MFNKKYDDDDDDDDDDTDQVAEHPGPASLLLLSTREPGRHWWVVPARRL